MRKKLFSSVFFVSTANLAPRFESQTSIRLIPLALNLAPANKIYPIINLSPNKQLSLYYCLFTLYSSSMDFVLICGLWKII